MQQHSFSDFSYAINKTSAKKGYKEILVCFIYNGTEVLRKLYIREKEGTSYIFEAKKIIDQEMKSGVLASYSYKFVKRKEAKNGGRPNWKWVAITAGIAAVAVAGMSVGMYFVGKNSANVNVRNTFDVKFTYYSCSPSGAAKVKRGEEYTCTFAPAQNKQIISIQSVYMGSELLDTDKYTFDVSKNMLTINKGVVSDDLYISAYGHGQHEASANLKYEISEDGQTAKAVDIDYDKTKLKEIGTIIVPDYVDGAEVVEIEEGVLAGCGYLQNLSVPFIGRFKYPELTNATIEDQMLGSIFGDKDYTGGIPVWQDYVEQGQHKMKKWIIPNDLSDITITGDSKIGIAAFSECSRINDVTITGNVGEISDYAFYGCKALESVVFPEGSVQKIGVSAFGSCNTLTAIGPVASDEETTLLNLRGVESVGANAFSDCAGAQETFIPETVTSIGAGAFASVGGIVMVEALEKPSGWDQTWVGDTTAVIYGSNGEVTPITDNDYKFIVTKEADGNEYAFLTEYVGQQYADSVVIPNTVTDGTENYPVRHLGMGLFYQYTPFINVTFKCTKLLAIGNYCFMGCTNLETITFDNSSTNEDFELEKIGMGAFLNCESLDFNETLTENYTDLNVEVTGFPASVKSIEASAFKGCTSLKQAAFPWVKSLGASSFEGCTSLTAVKINADIGNVGSRAYYGCSKFTNVYSYYNENEEEKEPEYIGSDFKRISDECFKGTAIKGEQVIPYFVTEIGAGAFENCAITKLKLETGVIESTLNKCKLMSIGANAFANCTQLTTVNDSGTTALGSYYGGLQNAFNLQSVGENAFKNCKGLASIQIGNTQYGGSALTSISDSAFEGCTGITSFSSPSTNLQSIGAKAFYGCVALTQVMNANGNLPATLGKIGDEAFVGCDNIPALIIHHSSVSPSSFDMGNKVFAGWVTETQNSTQVLSTNYELDVSHYVVISSGWLNEVYNPTRTTTGKINYTTAWGWTLTDYSSFSTGRMFGDIYYYTERFKCANFGSTDLYIHVINEA